MGMWIRVKKCGFCTVMLLNLEVFLENIFWVLVTEAKLKLAVELPLFQACFLKKKKNQCRVSRLI